MGSTPGASRRLGPDEPSACGERERFDSRADRAQSRTLRKRLGVVEQRFDLLVAAEIAEDPRKWQFV
jgi:hypothetical protein